MWQYFTNTFNRSSIVESFYSDTDQPINHRMIYAYCVSPGTEEDIVRSLVAQLAWSTDGNSIEEDIVLLYNRSNSPSGLPPSVDDWYRLLVSLCCRVPQTFIVIDALDECVDFNNLLSDLQQKVQSELQEKVKFVFSSRMNVIVDDDFPDSYRSVILDPETTSTDMHNYIQTEVQSKKKYLNCKDDKAREELSDRIVNAIERRAGGM